MFGKNYCMKFTIISFLYIVVGGVIIGGFIMYVFPILIRHRNAAFDDMRSPLTASIVTKSARQATSTLSAPSSPPLNTRAVFVDNFDTSYTVQEAGSMDESNNAFWWVSSGGYFYSGKGVGKTIQGALPAIDPWRVAYALSNSLDTDKGYYPQNIFRLVSRNVWKNFVQEVYVQITHLNMSASPNRNASNGVLLFNRYQDPYNLYYTGLRVDGALVIKKKVRGVYYTLAYKPWYKSAMAYDRTKNQDIIPLYHWIGLRSEVSTDTKTHVVTIKLFIDENDTGNWVLAVQATDDGTMYGGAPILDAGYAGIRTDFMDAMFRDYKIVEQ